MIDWPSREYNEEDNDGEASGPMAKASGRMAKARKGGRNKLCHRRSFVTEDEGGPSKGPHRRTGAEPGVEHEGGEDFFFDGIIHHIYQVKIPTSKPININVWLCHHTQKNLQIKFRMKVACKNLH